MDYDNTLVAAVDPGVEALGPEGILPKTFKQATVPRGGTPADWRALLPQLEGLPLLPCGAGQERKAPLDPASGGPLKGWQKAAFTPDQIGAMNGVVRSVGTRTGPDADGLLVFDLDGQTAIDLVVSHGLDPEQCSSWQVRRDTDPARLKVVFRLAQPLWGLLTRGKAEVTTKPGDKATGLKREAVEVFWSSGQVIVLGEHVTSGGHYTWRGSPSGIEVITAEHPLCSWVVELLSTAKQVSRPPLLDARPHTSLTTTDLPPRPPGELQRLLHEYVPPFDHNEGRRPALVELSLALWAHLGREEALAVMREHSPAVTDLESNIFTTAPTEYEPDSIWGHLREVYGADIRRHDLKNRAPISLNTAGSGGAGEPQQAAPDPEARQPRSALLNAALDAAEAGDHDTYAELQAELMGRFRMTASMVQAALIKLLTVRHAGPSTPEAGYVDITDVEHLDHLVPGFVVAREQTLLHAPKGTGKTLAALAIARAIILGEGLLDRSEAATPGRVLYLATDSGCASMHTQMQELGLLELPEFRPGPDQRFFIRGHHGRQAVSSWEATIPEILWLKREIEERQFDLVIIDSAKACLSLTEIDYTDNRAVGALLTLFQRVIAPRCAVVWLHHDGRENGHNAGAKAWAEIPVMVHRIERTEPPKDAPGGSGEDSKGPPPSALPRRWHCVKSRISGDERSFLYSLRPSGEFEIDPTVEIIGNCRDAVLAVMRQATATGEESLSYGALLERVAAASGRSIGTIRNTVTRMGRGSAPDLRRAKGGRWMLTHHGKLKQPPKGCVLSVSESGEKSVVDRVLDTHTQIHTVNPGIHTVNHGVTPPVTDQTQGQDSDSQESLTVTPTPLKQPPHPPWFEHLVELRRERPGDHAATLALTLDPLGQWRITGAAVQQWLPFADQRLAGSGDEGEP